VPKKKKNTIVISKKKIQDIIQKALGKTSKSEKPIISDVMIYFNKDGILYGEFVGMSAANIGWFGKDYFKEYEVKTPSVVNFGEEHLEKISFIRSNSVKLEIGEKSLVYLSPDGNEKFPVTFKKLKEYDPENDMTPPETHDEVKPMDITLDKKTVQFVDIEGSYDRSRLTQKDKDYNDVDHGYFETYVYARISKKEFLNLPKSDSLIFRRVQQFIKGKAAHPAIELQTLVKLDQKDGYKRVLSGMDFIKWHDTSVFDVRVSRDHFDKAVALLGDPITIIFTQDYVMLSNVGEHYWTTYLIGYVQMETDTVDIEDETGDLETSIQEVQKQTKDEEE